MHSRSFHLQTNMLQKSSVVRFTTEKVFQSIGAVFRIANGQNAVAILFAQSKVQRIGFEQRVHIAGIHLTPQISIYGKHTLLISYTTKSSKTQHNRTVARRVAAHQMAEISDRIALRRIDARKFAPQRTP
jgi:hypothetical protein